MPDAYEITDAQFIQYPNAISGAAALSVSLPACPAGRVQTVLQALAYCSAQETRVYWFTVRGVDGNHYPVTAPASVTIDPALTQWYPMLREGMELKLFPGEILYAWRAAATAGSTIAIYARIIESDMPFYQEIDKHKQLRRRRAATLIQKISQARGGGGATSGGSAMGFPVGRGHLEK